MGISEMARKTGILSALAVKQAKSRGYLSDGGGLYLQVMDVNVKSWVFRFRENGKLREMGLGATHTVSLAEARDKALLCRKQRDMGIDPIAARQHQRAAQKLEAAKAMTFKQCAAAYIESHRAGWQNAKHATQWTSTLETYAYPIIGDLSVSGVDTSLVMKIIEPIWRTKTETASRLRGRIENILNWATVSGYRTGENPARWRGHLDQLLPERSKVAKVQHHAALPYSEIAAFLQNLRNQEGISAIALEFAILTASRTNEVLGATWQEFDLIKNIWTIPATRMKGSKEHRVPLSTLSKKIILSMQSQKVSEFLFPGMKANKGLSNMAFLTLLRRMKRDDLTAHGFRSTFRDWAAERSNFPGEVAEHALAHSLPNRVEAAYQRGDLFEKRALMMESWAQFCIQTEPDNNIILLSANK